MNEEFDYIPVHVEKLDEVIPDEQIRNRFIDDDLFVATAPRPIPGQFEWRGGGGYGYFYAAHPVHIEDAAIPEIYDWIFRQWDDLRAQPLKVFTEEEIWDGLLGHLEEEGLDVGEALEMMDRPGDWGSSAHYLGLPTPLRMPDAQE